MYREPEPWELEPIAGTTRVGSGNQPRRVLAFTDPLLDPEDEQFGLDEQDYFDDRGE